MVARFLPFVLSLIPACLGRPPKPPRFDGLLDELLSDWPLDAWEIGADQPEPVRSAA